MFSSSSDKQKSFSFAPWKEQQRLKSLTLYLSPHGRRARLHGKKIIVSVNKDTENSVTIPLPHLRRVVFLGRPRCDGDLIYACVRHAIPVDFLDIFGRPLGYAMPLATETKNITLRPCEERSLQLARVIISAKITNTWSLLRRKIRIDPKHETLAFRASKAISFEQLRGIEGLAARAYYTYLPNLIKGFNFTERKSRPAPDPINMMLSFGYGMLHNRLVSALLSCGLNAKQGFFHQSRGTHCALASDLIEDMRFIIDKLVLRLIRLRQVLPKDFRTYGNVCKFSNPDTFKIYMDTFESMLATPFQAPCERPHINKGDNVSLNSWIDSTATAYAQWLEKELPYQALQVAA